MSSILKATPRAILKGIQDLSRRTPVLEAEQLPQHLPHIYLLTERGPTLPQVAIGDGLTTLYGTNVLDLRSPYATHQTVLASKVMANGNFCMVQRLKPAAAKTALLRLSAEVIPAEIFLYERNLDGSYVIGLDGLPKHVTVPDGDGGFDNVTVIGTRIVWHTTLDPYATVAKEFGKGVAVEYRDGDTIGGTMELSTLVDGSNPVVSTLYPILDLEVSSFGDYGNRVGLRLEAPNADDVAPGDYALMGAIGAYLYRFICVERPVNSATPISKDTIAGELSLDLTFKENVFHPSTGLPLSFDDTFIDAYTSLDDPSIPPVYGPFGRSHVYHSNLATILNMVIEGGDFQTNTVIGEKDYDTTAAAFGRSAAIRFTDKPENQQLLNLFTGIDQNGVPYWSLDVSNSVTFGGVSFGNNQVVYATGGSDGLPLDSNGKPDAKQILSIYDELAGIEMANYGDLEAKLLDVAKYPHSTFWDSGFSLATKKKMLVPMSRRKDIWVVLSTQMLGDYSGEAIAGTGTAVGTDGLVLDFGAGETTEFYNDTFVTIPAGLLTDGDNNPVPAGRYRANFLDTDWTLTPWEYQEANTISQETAYAVLLRTMASTFPESEIYGTPVCRVSIVGHCGKLLNTTYRGGILPLTIELADKVSRYMGAGTGNWTNGFAFDENPNNVVSNFRDINHIWKPAATYNGDWDAGLVWVQSFDRRSVFFPGLQTAYPDDTSVLNSIITVAACCFLEKVSQLVWRLLSGNSSLTNGQFIERSDRLINENVKDRFDGRFVIVPETFYTAADEQRGFSWSCKIHIYANNMKTVGSMTVVAHRMSDLNV